MSSLSGVNVHDNILGWTLQVSQLGIRWVRIDINWNQVELSKGKYSWSKIDSVISSVRSLGLNVYASIAYTPSWHKNKITDCPDKDTWKSFVHEVVLRYKNKINVYSIWNEPNLKAFYTGSKRDYFEKILIPGYEAVKEVNLSFLVAGLELSTQSSSSWTSWINSALKYKNYFDILAYHTYQKSGDMVIQSYNKGKYGILKWFIPKYRSYKSYFKKFHKPVWLTETGWETKKYGDSEVSKFYEQLLKDRNKIGVQEIIAYELRDYSEFPKLSWGLYHSNKTPKLSVDVIKRL